MDDERFEYFLGISVPIFQLNSEMQDFQNNYNSKEWILKDNQAYLQSKILLDHGFLHAFFTRKEIRLEPEDLIKYISTNCSIHRLRQVHSNKVLDARDIKKNNYPEADGLITNKKDQSLWIYSADCIPVLLADRVTGKVAASHVGWRGLRNKILNKTIEKLQSSGSKRKDILVALGPSISINKYQVHQKVVIDLSNSLEGNESLNKKSEDQILQSMIDFKIIKKSLKNEYYLLDLKLLALKQLLSQDIQKSMITINKNCSFSEESLFFSFRRDGKKHCQWSCIISN